MAREFSAVANLEVRGFFVSRVKIALMILVVLLLLVILVTLGALLAHEKGEDKSGQTRDEARIGGKQTHAMDFYRPQITFRPKESTDLWRYISAKIQVHILTFEFAM